MGNLFDRVFALAALAGALLSSLAARPVAAGPVPRFSHIIVIVAENKEFGEVIGNREMPNLNGWAKSYALLREYYAVTHPSLPNYLALVAGDYFGIQEDCINCLVRATSLADLLEAGGRTWKTYQEGLPEPGFTGSESGKYVIKHNPFVYFEAVRSDPARLERSVVPLSHLTPDLEQAKLPDFSLIVPDLCNSSHDCGVQVTDAWLGRVVGSILASPAFDRDCLLALTFDEGNTNKAARGLSQRTGGGKIATVLISPWVKKGCVDKTPYSHYSLLKTIAAAWGLRALGHAADPAVNVIAFPWVEQPPESRQPHAVIRSVYILSGFRDRR
jgi:phospholipase C